MIFENQLIYTGTTKRKSKKTEKEYELVNFLDSDGMQFSALLNCNLPREIKQLSNVLATFELKVGQYLSLSVGSIELA